MIWCIAIYVLTSSPMATSKNTGSIIQNESKLTSKTAEKVNVKVRKTAHIILFGFVAITLLIVFRGKKYVEIKAWFIATLLGVVDELHQMFVPDRTPSMRDVFIDSTGAASAIIIYLFLRGVLKLRNK